MFDGQRQVGETFVSTHAENMRRGLWLPGSQIAFCEIGNRYYLVNGQHRLRAVIEAAMPVEFSVVIYNCKTQDEVRAIYTRFDSNHRNRSEGQIAEAFHLAEKMGITQTTAKAVLHATPLLCNGLKPIYARHEASNEVRIAMGVLDMKLEAASSWKKEARLFEDALENAMWRHRNRLLSTSVAAPALMTLRHSPAKASAFWKGIADDDGLRRGDPRHALVTALKAGAKRNQLLSATSAAWNAWYAGRSLTQAKTTSDPETLEWAGTPLDGRRR